MAVASYKLDGDMLYHDGKALAQLRLFKIDGVNTDTYAGIAIYYFDSNEQIWICPEDGWRLKDANSGVIYNDILQIDSLYRSNPHKYYLLRSNKMLSKYEAITGGCISYNIDDDFIISALLPGMFWNSTRKFDIINKEFK